jgi:GDP/UDP-N,N'-diacetylbacillosamine 2-epimerase (hydrolysing)
VGGFKLKIGILTSSRADYGIYYPLLMKMKADAYFKMHLLAFGTHLSGKFGQTFRQIEADGFEISHSIDTLAENDTAGGIVRSMAKTLAAFSDLWDMESFDLLIALGDRYEMFSAVSSSVPFNIPVAHIHGGETTLGAIDNSFRHCITTMSELHFASCEEYKRRVVEIKGNEQGVFNTGALSIDNLASMDFLSVDDFYKKYKIDLSIPTILFTFHPETVSYSRNEEYIRTIVEALKELNKYQIIITMPNADTSGSIVRTSLESFVSASQNVYGIESFGSTAYLSCMKHCAFMLGNTSSGFVEASWFPKAVINIGDRQKGRILTSNIRSCRIDKEEILSSVNELDKIDLKPGENIYGDGNAAEKILSIIKNYGRGIL